MSQQRDLQGAQVVITGKLVIGTRSDIEDFINESGGVARSAVSGKTDLVIYGEKAGSKLEKAQELGIETISEADFYEQFGFTSDAPSPLELKDKAVVITGKLQIGTRDEIETYIADQGGLTRSSVTSKTDLVIYGEKAGSKLEKAQELGIDTMSEEEFYRRAGLA